MAVLLCGVWCVVLDGVSLGGELVGGVGEGGWEAGEGRAGSWTGVGRRGLGRFRGLLVDGRLGLCCSESAGELGRWSN